MTVNNEPLNFNYNGVLGLALPLNSKIAQTIKPVTNNKADGASFSSNIFGITPVSQAPAAHFFSLTLARPGSDRLPSLLGIGRHPANVVPDPSLIEYDLIISDNPGDLFWKADLTAITVYKDGVAKSVTMPRGVKGTPYPVAVLDSGVPYILTTSEIANGIYGALDIGPAADGHCELNSTCTIAFLTDVGARLCPMRNPFKFDCHARQPKRNSSTSTRPYH